jgi:hypothetical protein
MMWAEKQLQELLPVPYFHVVLTIPEELNCLVARNQVTIYNILFQAAKMTLTTIAADPKHLGAKIGFVAVLHTWGQTLQRHPHLHCIVPGGGLAFDYSKWIPARKRFFLPVHVLRDFFRNRFLELLTQAYEQGKLTFTEETESLAETESFEAYCKSLQDKKWVVYSQPPFGGPEQVVKYIARYTHRVAIANQRILKLSDEQVSFAYKDYRDDKNKVMELHPHEFIRRFSQHILPSRFHKIRYYGIMSSANRRKDWALARLLIGLASSFSNLILGFDQLFKKLMGCSINTCPKCENPSLVVGRRLPSMVEVFRESNTPITARAIRAVIATTKSRPGRERSPP